MHIHSLWQFKFYKDYEFHSVTNYSEANFHEIRFDKPAPNRSHEKNYSDIPHPLLCTWSVILIFEVAIFWEFYHSISANIELMLMTMTMEKSAGPDGGEETRAEHGRTEGEVIVIVMMMMMMMMVVVVMMMVVMMMIVMIFMLMLMIAMVILVMMA